MSPFFPVAPGAIQRAYIDGDRRSLAAALGVLIHGVRRFVKDPDVRADVLLWTEDQHHLELIASVGFAPDYVRDVQHLIEPKGEAGERGLVRKALRTRTSVLSSDCANDPLWRSCSIPPERDDTKSEFVVYLGGPFHCVLNFESARAGVFTAAVAAAIEQASAEMLLVVHHELHHAGEGLLQDSLKALRASSDAAQVHEICLTAVMSVMGASHGGVFVPPNAPAEGQVRNLRLVVNRGLDLLKAGAPYSVGRFGTIKQALENKDGNDAYRCESMRGMKGTRDLVQGVKMLANYSYVLRVRGLPIAVVHVESDSLPALPERHRRACAAFLEEACGHLAALHWAEANEQRKGLVQWLDGLWQNEHDEFRGLTQELTAIHQAASREGPVQADLDELYSCADKLAATLISLVDQLWRLCRTPTAHPQDVLRQLYEEALESEVPEPDRRGITVEGDWDFQVLAQEQALRGTLAALAALTHGSHSDARSVSIRLRGSRLEGRGLIEVESVTEFEPGSELTELFDADQDDIRKLSLVGLLSVSNWKLVESDAEPEQGRVRLVLAVPITAVEA